MCVQKVDHLTTTPCFNLFRHKVQTLNFLDKNQYVIQCCLVFFNITYRAILFLKGIVDTKVALEIFLDPDTNLQCIFSVVYQFRASPRPKL